MLSDVGTQPNKPILPGGRTNISFSFPATPRSVNTKLTLPLEGSGFEIEWSATDETDFDVHAAHADNALEIELHADRMPTYLDTNFTQLEIVNETAVELGLPSVSSEYRLTHTASTPLESLNATWHNKNGTTKGGAIQATDVPTSITFVYSEAAKLYTHSWTKARVPLRGNGPTQ